MSNEGILNTSGSTPVGTGRFPITPYVVGPTGQAGYQTIQSAINAANSAGGGMVFIQPGIYTENLTLFSGVSLQGASEQSTFINGSHTPPTSGTLNIFRLAFSHATSILNSNAAGTTTIIAEDCAVTVTNGYTFNLPNWTGVIALDNFGNFGTNDGFINNTAGAVVAVFFSGMGIGNVNPMILSGTTIINTSDNSAPINFTSNASYTIDNCSFTNTITLVGASTGLMANSRISSGSSTAIIMNSSASNTLENLVIDTSASPAISGTGGGVLKISDANFINNSSIAGTIVRTTGSASILGEVRAGNDIGGISGCTSITNANSTTIGAGTGTVKMTSGNNANNAAWVKIYVGTTAYWIPAWTTNAP